MKRRTILFAVACATLILQISTQPAWAADQTTKVKTGKGLKSGLELALNPNNGDVLITFEEKGQIFATLARNKGGQYSTKKAKVVSTGDDAYRPTAAWDEAAGEFLVAWDTGPADLVAATTRSAVQPADINARRVKAKNGKATQSQISVVSDGKINLGPDLRRMADDDEVVLHFVQNQDPSGITRSSFLQPRVRLVRNVFRGEGDKPANLGNLTAGLAIAEVSEGMNGEVTLGFTQFASGVPTALAALVELKQPRMTRYDNWTPSLFPAVSTYAVGVAALDSTARSVRLNDRVILGWGEGPPIPGCGQPWVERFQMWNSQGTALVNTADNCGISNFGYRQDVAGRRRAATTVFAAAAGRDRTIRLYRLDPAVPLIVRDLLSRKKNILDMRLQVLPGSTTALLVWIEAKNAKKHEVWMHVFDLP